jgi:hypothetical protein
MPAGAGLGGLGLLPRGGWGVLDGARCGRGGAGCEWAARDAGDLWDVNPFRSLALGP